jgi:hypothetical protein
MSTPTKYSVTTEHDRLPILRGAFVVWRVGSSGVEIRGIFADEASAQADPVANIAVAGWKITAAPLIGWNALALKGGEG